MVFGLLLKQAPVVGSCYGFATIAIQVYKATTPTSVIVAAAKGIAVDYTRLIIKYPVLCIC
jgi:hypothetical protein